MAQNSFKTHQGKWIMKKVVLTAAVAAVEKGDLIGITTAGDATKALGTNASAAIVGIAAEDSASSASTRDLRVMVPNEPNARMIGRITDGVGVVGTDVDRPCDLEDHEGIDVDSNTYGHVLLVDVTVACTDGNVGEGIFEIIKTPPFISVDMGAS
jgi:hypothetical protein